MAASADNDAAGPCRGPSQGPEWDCQGDHEATAPASQNRAFRRPRPGSGGANSLAAGYFGCGTIRK
jgi:hypothetical protein